VPDPATPTAEPERRSGALLAGSRRDVRSEAITSTLLGIALVVSVIHFAVLLTDYRQLFVHPDYYLHILPESLRAGVSPAPYDLVFALQPRAIGESRPRFLAYLVQALDQKLRLALYD
jgi:hypothetical protein